MPEYTVVSTAPKQHERRVTVENEKGSRVHLRMHRFAIIGKGDRVFVDPNHPSRISVVSVDANDRILITPHFEKTDQFKIGSVEFQVRITEIVTQIDLENYLYLERFHYKTSTALSSDDGDDQNAEANGGCRKAVLLCYIKIGLRWQPVGYIELHMPLLMVKPRHVLFSKAFNHPSRPIEWDLWDHHSIRKYVNSIVRIARVVTSPEFRGLGITKVLLKGTKDFAKERWHVKGQRPIFIEILAEMLKYVDFVSSAGLRYVGNTEGNLKRVYKDLTYMQRDYNISSGIMTLQKKYLTKLQTGAKTLGKDIDELLCELKHIAENPDLLQSLKPSEWYLFKSVLRLPIPYYLGGLDDYTEGYIEKYLAEITSQKSITRNFDVKPTNINLRNVKIYSTYQVPQTRNVRTIMECFGLEGEVLGARIVGPIDIVASGGNIVFISGPSGSGKSVLLKALDPDFSSPHILIEKDFTRESFYTAGWMKDIISELPLIEYFAEKWGMERAIAALNQAGLSEAFVYLKPFALLSRGQKYRARLAELALGQDQVWLIDEFGADLDSLTARIVANNLRKHVIKYKRIAFVAAANHRHYLDALRPTRVISLNHGAKFEILNYKEYIDEFYNEQF